MNQLRLFFVFLMLGAVPMTVFAQGSAPASAPGTVVINLKWAPESAHCDDGDDNDGDGLTDCLDRDCRGFLACRPELCTNRVDDDGDGKEDCSDDECTSKPVCQEAGHCLDGRDNDGDLAFDCSDSDCDAVVECTTAKDALKAAEAAEVERQLRPFKVKAALEALANARKAEVEARKTLAEEPTEATAIAELGTAIAEQLRIRKDLGNLGWSAPAAPAVASAPGSAPAAPPAVPTAAPVRPGNVNFTPPRAEASRRP